MKEIKEGKVKEYLEEVLYRVKEENLLCCEKQGIALGGNNYPFLIEICIKEIRYDIEKRKVTEKLKKSILKELKNLETINTILKLFPNMLWNKIEKILKKKQNE